MKKLTKAQKAVFPQFIAYIDFTAKASEEHGKGVFTKAMEETNLLDAMRRVEKCIQERHEEIYLATIYVKTDKENEWGEPLYKSELMTRVHNDDYGRLQDSKWHFHDEDHGETAHGYHAWYADKDSRNGSLSYCHEMNAGA